jgi:hypothetical protein
MQIGDVQQVHEPQGVVAVRIFAKTATSLHRLLRTGRHRIRVQATDRFRTIRRFNRWPFGARWHIRRQSGTFTCFIAGIEPIASQSAHRIT